MEIETKLLIQLNKPASWPVRKEKEWTIDSNHELGSIKLFFFII